MDIKYTNDGGFTYTYKRQSYSVVREGIGTATDILSLDDAKAHLRVDGVEEDVIIEAIIGASVDSCEKYVGDDFQRTNYMIYTDCFERVMQLPKKAFMEIVAINYRDEDGALETLGGYNFDPATSKLVLTDIPKVSKDYASPVFLTVSCGYDVTGTTANRELPMSLVAAVKLILGHLYENRQEVTAFKQVQLPKASEFLMNPYKTIALG